MQLQLLFGHADADLLGDDLLVDVVDLAVHEPLLVFPGLLSPLVPALLGSEFRTLVELHGDEGCRAGGIPCGGAEIGKIGRGRR